MNYALLRYFAFVALVALAACETTGGHIQQRRRQVAAARGGSLQARWDAVENDPAMADARIRIAFDMRRYAETNPEVPVPERVMQKVHQHVEDLASGRVSNARPEAYALADKWADEVLHQPELSRQVACRLAMLPGASYGAH